MSHEYVYKISSRYLQKWLRYNIKHVKNRHFSRDAEPEPEPEPEPPEPTHFGRSRSRSRSRQNGLLGAGAGAGAVKKRGGSVSENEYNCGKITEC